MTSTVWGHKGHEDDGDPVGVSFTDLGSEVQLHTTVWSRDGVATWGVEVTIDRESLRDALLEEGIVTALIEGA